MMTFKKVILAVSILAVGVTVAAAQDISEKTTRSKGFEKVLKQVEKQAVQQHYQALLQKEQQQVCEDEKNACSAENTANTEQERCTECGRTREEVARVGHHHKPPYIFEKQSKPAPKTKPTVKRAGDVYLATSKTGNVFILPIGVRAKKAKQNPEPEVYQFPPQQTTVVTSQKDYPPYW